MRNFLNCLLLASVLFTSTSTALFAQQWPNSNYTLVGNSHVNLSNHNRVESGSVGVNAWGGFARFKSYSSVNSSGTHVKAKNFSCESQVSIASKVYDVAAAPVPAMLQFTASYGNLSNKTINSNTTTTLSSNYNNLLIKSGAKVTLTGNIFGNITLESGAEVTFTKADISIGSLKVCKGKSWSNTRVKFSNHCNVRVQKWVRMEEYCQFNPDKKDISCFIGNGSNDQFKFYMIGGYNKFNGCVYIPTGTFKLVESSGCGSLSNNPVEMCGQFICEKIESDCRYVKWNYGKGCNQSGGSTSSDVTAPVLTCPPAQVFCKSASGNYVVADLTATDNNCSSTGNSLSINNTNSGGNGGNLSFGSNCFKIDPPVSGTNGGISYTVVQQGGEPMFLNVTGTGVQSVNVKGGPVSVTYSNPPYTNLTAPINPSNGKPYGISHFTICRTEGSTGGGGGSTTPCLTATYQITGATTRSGTGFNASGCFNTGVSTIKWTVKDAAGNTSTCTTTVTVNNAPTLCISATSISSNCGGLKLTASTGSSTGITYEWSLNNTIISTNASIELTPESAAGVYSVKATNGSGCSSTATYNFSPDNFISKYSVLGIKQVSLGENNQVITGSVGATSSYGKVQIQKNSSVASAGSFVKAASIALQSPVNAPNKIYSKVSISLPAIEQFTGSYSSLSDLTVSSSTTLNGDYNNLYIKKGILVTLNGTRFRNLTIEEGATVTFTSAVINLESFIIGVGLSTSFARIIFTQPSVSVRVSKQVIVAERSVVNNENKKLTFHVNNNSCYGERFLVKGNGSVFYGNINMPDGELKVQSNCFTSYENCNTGTSTGTACATTFMTGWYIAEYIQSGKNVVWNKANCGTNPPPPVDTTNELPVIACPAPIVLDVQTNCSAFYTVSIPNATDDGEIDTVYGVRSDGLPLNAAYPIGVTTITWTAKDNLGSTVSCTQPITVADTQKPILICAQNIALNTDNVLTGLQLLNLQAPATSDNCTQSVTVTARRSDGLDISDLFPIGTTFITWIATDDAGNKDSCQQVITITLEVPKFAVAPEDAIRCEVPSGNYTTPPATLTGQAIVYSITYAVTGATNRTGTGLNASGFYNPGTSTVTWTIKDITGDEQTVSAQVIVNQSASAIITAETGDLFCGESNSLTVSTNATGAVNYEWSLNNGPVFSTSRSIVLNSTAAEGTYTAKAISLDGCGTATATYSYSYPNIISKYLIVGVNKVTVGNNNSVLAGSIGVSASNGIVTAGSSFNATAPGSFVKSPLVSLGTGSLVNNWMNSPTTFAFPELLENTSNPAAFADFTVPPGANTVLADNFNNITISAGARVILYGTVFGKIEIGAGAIVKLERKDISIGELIVRQGTTLEPTILEFAYNTSAEMRIKNRIWIEENTIINPTLVRVTFFVGNEPISGEKVTIRACNAKVNCNLYAPFGKIMLTNTSGCTAPSSMKGLFVANEVVSDVPGVVWSKYDCNNGSNGDGNETPDRANNGNPNGNITLTEAKELKAVVTPNPTRNVFRMVVSSNDKAPAVVKIADAAGRIVYQQQNVALNTPIIFGDKFNAGVYFAEIIQGKQRKLVKLVKTN
jgi:hypothetical protein